MKMLKFLSILSLLFFSIVNMTAQNTDSLIYQTDHILITKNNETDHFEITNKLTQEKLQNVKFVRPVMNHYQVLNEDMKVLYLNENWEIADTLDNFFGLCGTVPHYTMSVKENKDSLFVYENETFYDFNDEIPAEKIFAISKNETDSILFINGHTEFNFTANFNAFGDVLINPRTIFLAKDGKFFEPGKSEEVYDSLDFSNHYHYIQTSKNGLQGVLGVTTPKYREISTFDLYLAKAVLPDGRKIFIDTEGVEYY